MKPITNGQDVIDSRDVIARIEELQDERAALVDTAEEVETELCAAESGTIAEDETSAAFSDATQALHDWDEDNGEELKALLALAEEGESSAGDWKHGEGLIRDSYFEDYAREMAEDIGALEDCGHWPATCIDWERAASELQQDYSQIDFDGVTYWVRAC